jgi:hypothetical protein
MKQIVIVGATSAIATHCARLWVQAEPVQLMLIGRNEEKLQRLTRDLQVRSPQSVIQSQQMDLLDPVRIKTWVASWAETPIDTVLIAHGSLPEQKDCQLDIEQVAAAMQVNAISPVLFAEAFAERLQAQGRGCLAVIGSVAGAREKVKLLLWCCQGID